jgi:hypothetical protein
MTKPVMLPAGSSNMAIVVPGMTSVGGMRILPPRLWALFSVA